MFLTLFVPPKRCFIFSIFLFHIISIFPFDYFIPLPPLVTLSVPRTNWKYVTSLELTFFLLAFLFKYRGIRDRYVNIVRSHIHPEFAPSFERWKTPKSSWNASFRQWERKNNGPRIKTLRCLVYVRGTTTVETFRLLWTAVRHQQPLSRDFMFFFSFWLRASDHEDSLSPLCPFPLANHNNSHPTSL